MRVLFVSNLYPPYFLGGYEVACKDIAEQFAKQGIDTSILCSSYGLDSPSRDGDIYRILDVRSDFNGFKSLHEKAISLFYNPRNYNRTIEIIKEIKPDIGSVWSINGISAAPLFALQKAGVPYVIHLFDRCLSFIRKKGWKRILNPILFNRLQLEHMVSCSESLKDDYVKNGFDENSIRVIPHGVQPEQRLFDKKAIDSHNLKLLFVGRLWEAKGVDLAIRCLPLLRKKGITATLTIVGSGEENYREHLREVIKNVGARDSVKFVNSVPRELLKSYYKSHDILLFPTYSWYKEPFGIVILEAMSHGLPVIASECGGPIEIIDQGENGLLFALGDLNSLAESIEMIVRSEKIQKRIRKLGYESIIHNFNIQEIGSRMIDLYQSIVIGK